MKSAGGFPPLYQLIWSLISAFAALTYRQVTPIATPAMYPALFIRCDDYRGLVMHCEWIVQPNQMCLSSPICLQILDLKGVHSCSRGPKKME